MVDTDRQPRRRYFGGVCALIAVVFIWVSSSFAMNSIFGDQEYNKPFLITYLNTATFSCYLLPLLFVRKRSSEEYAKLIIRDSESNNEQQQDGDIHSTKLSTTETIKLSLAFCILWFCANYTTNASLAYTTVGSSTILSSTSGLFTLAIGAMFHVEKFSLVRVIAVCLSFLGVVLVSHSDTSEPSDAPLLGDMLALAGAFFYGCYTTLLKLRIGDESRINMPLFFGFVGAFNIILLWPFFFILHFTGMETFQIPHGSILWATIVLNAFIGTFLSDYLWLLAMLMTSPLVVTLGISLTIPLALVGDLLFKQIVPGLQYAAGAILVLIGFFAVNTVTLSDVEQEATYADRTLVSQDDENDE
ncbi:hypothetical protein K492DRAFT_229681 [Lichtheimia hyalospora FSU 10163]|nr:hypothetical protein K492DRAFT_229681 [Lichtheimia hyalospora FSU 10163]